jgi:outer membrane protein OmpA-like peptidoglycan-associated protein
MKNILLTCCILSSSICGYGQTKDTFNVYFPFNIANITKESAANIDKLIFKDRLIHGDKLIVLGYADYVGGSSYNDTLSMTRAKNVRDYLITTGFDDNDIKLCIGKGKIDRTNVSGKEGYAPDRKVQIIIDRVAMAVKPPDTPARGADQDEKIDFKHLKVNQTFTLKNIFFKLNSPVLLDKSLPDLNNLLNILKENPTINIQIEGHVCCMGPTEGADSKYQHRNLSECRAEAIYNYLVEKGINKERLKYIGLGNRNPIVRNEVTEEDKMKNRRVEIRILSK